jgi:hypothetical protein
LVGSVWLCCTTSAIAAQYNAADLLKFRPHQPGINYTTPSSQEQTSCKVDLVRGQDGGSAWVLRDGQGRILRKFIATAGHKHADVWCYYLDGVEVYRELGERPNEFRWLNSAGCKWGVDSDQDGRIDTWKVISAEEVSQEVLQAVVTKDLARLQALWISDAEMKSLELPAAEITRLESLRQQAPSKFQATVAKLAALGGQLRWERLESSGPQCVPAEQGGMSHDLLKYPRCMVLYEANGKHDWIQIGELLQVGSAWRLTDAPVPGGTPESGNESTQTADPAIQALLDQLKQVDSQSPRGEAAPAPNPDVVAYNGKRADIIERLLGKVKTEEREQWLRQLTDCLSAAAQSAPVGDKQYYRRLQQLEQEVTREQPGSNLAAYITFREMSADYAGNMGKVGPEFAKVQEQWLARLAKFVQDYPRAEDTSDALLQLGMVSEFVGKEIEAKKWYQQLAGNFPDKKLLSDKAAGALRRLELEGKPFELSGASLSGQSFDISSLRGKVAVVYYWASWNQQCVGDFARLKLLLTKYQPQGLELVCVNLDNSPPEANAAQATTAPPGVQLFTPGGLDSPLATQYGIMVLPNMFLIGKDGSVASRNVQLANLEDEVKKLLK